MKILYINDHLNDYHGAAIHGRKLISALEKDNIKVIPYPELVSEKRIKYKQSNKDKLKLLLPKWFNEIVVYYRRHLIRIFEFHSILRIIRQNNPDFIIVRPLMGDNISILLKKVAKIPIVLEVNSPMFYEWDEVNKTESKLNLIRMNEIATWREADAIYVVSKDLKNIVLSNLVDVSKDIWVIPNGVDISDYAENGNASELKKETSKEVVIGFIGSFNIWHGIEFIIDVFNDVLEVRPNIKLVLLGDGVLKSKMVQKIIDLNIPQGKIDFMGRLPYEEMIQKMKYVDIFVAPYLYKKNFYFSPLKIFDYMATGKAILASRIGQIKEILTDRVDSRLVEPNDNDAYVRALIELIDSQNMRDILGSKAKERVKEFTWEKAANKLIEGLKSLKTGIIKEPIKQ